MRSAVRRVGVAVAAAGALAVWPAPAVGQASGETRLLREAAARESRGDLEGAERVLRRLLEVSPGSSGGLFALERVLRARGEEAAVLPAVDAFLAQAPTSPGVRSLKLRVLAEIDSLSGVREEAERWIAREPRLEAAYGEVARAYERAFGVQEALDVLLRGRGAVGHADAFALELGDLLARAGREGDATEEWARAVRADPGQAASVARRMRETGTPPERIRELVERVAAGGDGERRRAAATLALDSGLEPEAAALARSLAAELEGRRRGAFLADVARRAREAGMASLAAWAYGELAEDAGDASERRPFEERLVEAALAAGDTADALEAQRRLVRSLPPGSVDRRRAQADRIRLEAPAADPAHLRALLQAFRTDFPGAPELDDLAATVARGLVARGDEEGAVSVLEEVDGPRSLIERAYLLLDRGELGEARTALLAAVPGLTPSDATGVIQLAGLLGRLSPPAAGLLARAAADTHRGSGAHAASELADGLADVPADERATLLAEAARLAEEAGDGREAAALRRRLLADHPESRETAAAALALARWVARTPGGVPEAIRLLEDLIVERPEAAVVPGARRELERLRLRARGM